MRPNSFLKKLLTSFIAGLTFAAALLLLGNSGSVSWFPPFVVFPLVAIAFLVALLFPFLRYYRQKKQKISPDKVYVFLYAFIRYCIAFNLASFGWKKLLGLQFLIVGNCAVEAIYYLSKSLSSPKSSPLLWKVQAGNLPLKKVRGKIHPYFCPQ